MFSFNNILQVSNRQKVVILSAYTQHIHDQKLEDSGKFVTFSCPDYFTFLMIGDVAWEKNAERIKLSSDESSFQNIIHNKCDAAQFLLLKSFLAI